MKAAALVALLFSLGACAMASGQLDIILLNSPRVIISYPENFSIAGRFVPAGAYSLEASGGGIDQNGADLGTTVIIAPSTPIHFLVVNGKPYRGEIRLSVSGTNLQADNLVTLEEYLYGVIGKEMPGNDLEALKAQAVASRTLAANALRSGKPIHASVTQQVYGGVDSEREISNEAVDDTRGLVLTYRGSLVESPLFSSTCGGITEASEDVFGKKISYLRSIPDNGDSGGAPYCAYSPYFQWTVSWTAESLKNNLYPYGIRGDVTDFIPAETDRNGRVRRLRVKTTEGEWTLSGFAIRKALKRPDGKPLYSTWFTIGRETVDGRPAFIASGKGQGHGVGMCQWGAIGMARSGKTYKEILSHYYPGTGLTDLSIRSWYGR